MRRKGDQRMPKWSQRLPKGSQKDAKHEPKGTLLLCWDPNKTRGAKKGAKGCQHWGQRLPKGIIYPAPRVMRTSMLRLRGAPRGQPKCNNDYVTASSSSSSSLSVVGACHLGRQVLTMRAARLQISAASCRCQCFCSPMALEPPRCLATAVAA